MICTYKYTNSYQEDAELSLIRVDVDWQDIVFSLLRPLIIRKRIRNYLLYFVRSFSYFPYLLFLFKVDFNVKYILLKHIFT